MKRYSVSNTLLKVRIDVDWAEADVDMVLAEVSRMVPFTHSVKGSQTPKAESVDRFLKAVFEEFKSDPYKDTEWQKKGVQHKKAYGLMQGCCSIEFEINLLRCPIEQLPAMINEIQKVVSKLVSKHVRYYKSNTTKSSGIGLALVG